MNDTTNESPVALVERASAIVTASGILENPYFRALRSGEMTLPVFLKSQQQFYFAVDYFSRPMSALVMRMDCPRRRLSILENIVEEHGGFEPNRFHETTFRAFLEQLSPSAGSRDIEMRPPVHAFNTAIMSACSQGELAVGIACLGVIEYAFAEISSAIGQAVIDRGWVPEGKLVHYSVHAELDKKHAAEFFELLVTEWADAKTRRSIEQGLQLGVYLFDRLYRDLTN
ncbi:TenA family transcriptional regulator [Allorhodopirellula heiligendammensis]|uniref:PqqC-like protein n=1 Tax=Allorhodopirellula heiligendammensis TaxID=2714739 RepID=A0A5C6BIH8_9BACT|nr:iron-containing redox enzyme family protein [Allorhodopirellula heiligendammensis]TWU11136.1 hypothetical protein Poly21_50430 [Allorhodopirellula heiligendammensis]